MNEKQTMLKVMRYNDKVVSGYLINDDGQVFQSRGAKRVPVNYFLKNGTYFFKIIMNGKIADVPALDLVLSNFTDKPSDYKSVASFNRVVINEKKPLKLSNLYWKKLDSVKSGEAFYASEFEKQFMRQVFVSGVLTAIKINEHGQVFNSAGKEIKPKLSRLGKPYLEINMPFNMGMKLVNLADIVAETYHVPKNDFLINYHISFLDKDKKNCAKNNVILWPEGHSGIARKKIVKVLKDGKFFGVFDSVKKCSEIINIPRRRVSEILKTGCSKNGFEVMHINLS